MGTEEERKELFSNIPAQLTIKQNIWVCYTRDKLPVNPHNGNAARSNDSSTWSDFDTALNYYLAHQDDGIAGIGIEFTGTGFVGVDLDNCRDPQTGELNEQARDIVKMLDSYTEISPSWRGLHIICTGELPPGARRKGSVEMYNEGRYFTMTGNRLADTPDWVGNRPQELAEVHGKYIQGPSKNAVEIVRNAPVSEDDDSLIERCVAAANGDKFKKLFDGDTSGYTSPSEADLALCSHLAFWTGNDDAQIDRIFRRSKLYRDKWDKKHGAETYGERTIRKALESCTESYTRIFLPSGTSTVMTCTAQTLDGTRRAVCIVQDKNNDAAEIPLVPDFPNIMAGAAGDFARLYGEYLETPEQFLYMAFLTCAGTILADRITINSEISPQPRFFTVLLGESADERKSTAEHKTIQFFRETLQDFPVCYGVGSAEGLQNRLTENNKLLLCFDEFKSFVSKAKIDTSVLLPCVNTLFEVNHYESRTKSTSISLDNVFLSMLAASTVGTYESVWDSSFTAIGFNNRLFLVPGKGERKFSIPRRVPDDARNRIKRQLAGMLPKDPVVMEITDEGRKLFDHFYTHLERSIHAKRLDTYALRFMPLLALNENKSVIDEDIVDKVIRLMNWQLAVRREHDPIDAENNIAKIEERIRRLLASGPMNERDLKKRCHVERIGLFAYENAKKNLERGRELSLDKGTGLWKRD